MNCFSQLTVNTYPNPATNNLDFEIKDIDLESYSEGSFELFNDNMRDVRKMTMIEFKKNKISSKTYRASWNVSDLPRGVYYLALKSGSKVVQTKTILLH